jgi:hypothetical protein
MLNSLSNLLRKGKGSQTMEFHTNVTSVMEEFGWTLKVNSMCANSGLGERVGFINEASKAFEELSKAAHSQSIHF